MKKKNSIDQITVVDAVETLWKTGIAFSDSALLDAQVLVAHICTKPRTWVLAHPEEQLNSHQIQSLQKIKSQLSQGIPLPYILGKWEFYGREFIITPDVLIPRPETELLVEHALGWLKRHPGSRRAAEAGVGSGIISISLALEVPHLRITATDISPEALKVARGNANKFRVVERIDFLQNTLLEGLEGPFDMIAANLPYIPTETLKTLQVSKHEPEIALDGGDDGLDLIRKFVIYAASHLASPGLLLMEIEYRQGEVVEKLAQTHFPEASVEIIQDYSGQNRLLKVQCNSPTK